MKNSFTCVRSLPNLDVFVFDLIAVHSHMAYKLSKIFLFEVVITQDIFTKGGIDIIIGRVWIACYTIVTNIWPRCDNSRVEICEWNNVRLVHLNVSKIYTAFRFVDVFKINYRQWQTARALPSFIPPHPINNVGCSEACKNRTKRRRVKKKNMRNNSSHKSRCWNLNNK